MTADREGSLCSDLPFPVFTARPGHQSLYYFEVLISELNGQVLFSVFKIFLFSRWMRIGLSLREFNFYSQSIGDFPNTLAIESSGKFYELGGVQHRVKASGGFGKDDVIGCGLRILPSTDRQIFFTKNGEIWGTIKFN
jgi:hypothetical protein